jgi:hypothetical protein
MILLKHMAEKMKVETAEGEGATFFIRIPTNK